MSLLTKIIYGILFVLLLIHPHFITGHVVSLPDAYAQSLATLTLVVIAGVVYLLNAREIKRRENEKNKIENELDISSNKLTDAYKYIGKLNRRLPLLNDVTTALIKQSKHNKKGKKDIFEDLLATATVSLANASWGMFRFVDMANERTVREFVHTTRSHVFLKPKVSNRILVQTRTQIQPVLKIETLYALVTSDREATTQCFFVFPPGKNNLESERSTLQAIVDQAQLLYQYLYESSEGQKERTTV